MLSQGKYHPAFVLSFLVCLVFDYTLAVCLFFCLRKKRGKKRKEGEQKPWVKLAAAATRKGNELLLQMAG